MVRLSDEGGTRSVTDIRGGGASWIGSLPACHHVRDGLTSWLAAMPSGWTCCPDSYATIRTGLDVTIPAASFDAVPRSGPIEFRGSS
ncbi:hypothetical protein [Mangrovicoccus ximenensis]|uniref:hypothetical protein n=1 Tax=Mangrovicoccus ximenensis TaxID=1911570 RepID=UPI000D3AEBC7|nr:hypothetical protein [Mangrovicoccus ximenensis]